MRLCVMSSVLLLTLLVTMSASAQGPCLEEEGTARHTAPRVPRAPAGTPRLHIPWLRWLQSCGSGWTAVWAERQTAQLIRAPRRPLQAAGPRVSGSFELQFFSTAYTQRALSYTPVQCSARREASVFCSFQLDAVIIFTFSITLFK